MIVGTENEVACQFNSALGWCGLKVYRTIEMMAWACSRDDRLAKGISIMLTFDLLVPRGFELMARSNMPRLTSHAS